MLISVRDRAGNCSSPLCAASPPLAGRTVSFPVLWISSGTGFTALGDQPQRCGSARGARPQPRQPRDTTAREGTASAALPRARRPERGRGERRRGGQGAGSAAGCTVLPTPRECGGRNFAKLHPGLRGDPGETEPGRPAAAGDRPGSPSGAGQRSRALREGQAAAREAVGSPREAAAAGSDVPASLRSRSGWPCAAPRTRRAMAGPCPGGSAEDRQLRVRVSLPRRAAAGVHSAPCAAALRHNTQL